MTAYQNQVNKNSFKINLLQNKTVNLKKLMVEFCIMQQYIQPLIQFFHLHPHFAGIFTFFVVFCEAMAVIGVVVPGSITMTAIGLLIGTNVIPAGNTFLWGICGAILGDEVSYLLGRYYKDQLHKIWPFKKHPEFLVKSEIFFSKHGGKSVFIGRFFGPMRSMIPMVAGMLKMTQGRFLLAAIPSAAIWAVMYIMPGVLLGALSMELPPKIATQFALIILGAIIIFWAIVWIMHRFAKTIYNKLDEWIMALWLLMRNSYACRWFVKLLTDPREPNNHSQLALFFLGILTITLFIFTLQNTLHHGIITILNEPVFNMLQSFRTLRLDKVMVTITALGEPELLLVIGTIFGLWLIYKRYYYTAIHWVLLMLAAVILVEGIKHLAFFPRPNYSLNGHNSSSLPSGHTTLSIAFFGFLAALASRYVAKEKFWFPYIFASVIISLIILSRLYLGAHWVSDIICGIFAGVSLALVFTISYRRIHKQDLTVWPLITTYIAIFFVVWFGYNLIYFKKQLENNTIHWPTQTITTNDLFAQKANIPVYRENRLGRPTDIFNVQSLNSLEEVKQNLLQQGWEIQPPDFTFNGMLLRLLGNSLLSQMPLLPQLYHNKPAILVMTKTINNSDNYLLLQFWESDIILTDSKLPLYLGVIAYRKLETRFLSLHHNHQKTIEFYGAIAGLSPLEKNYKVTQLTYPLATLPPEIKDLNWDGKIILITPKIKNKVK